MQRVVVTGMGCISSVGHTAEESWAAIVEGRTGIGPIATFPADLHAVRVAAEVKNYDPAKHFDERRLTMLDRTSQFALIAAHEAVAQAGVDFSNGLADDTAVIIGTGIGAVRTFDESFRRLYGIDNRRVHPFTVPRAMTCAAASMVSIEFGTRGPAFVVTSACASANHAIGLAFWMVRTGQARAAIAGGTEACITAVAMKSWEALRVMATDTCRPFSRDRRGMTIGEGAGIYVLEDLDGARARGAEIIAEVVGFGMTSDAGDMVQPSEVGAAKAICKALRDATMAPDDIDYVNAHGTGTTINDITETRALRRSFGPHADRLAISSTKAVHGHGLGAAGALELVAVLGALRDQVAPPTANFTDPDPQCDLDYVPNRPREVPIRAALSNSFAFGGLNAVLALRRFN